MSIIYFDICSIPLFLMILLICWSRKIYKGTANQLFIVVVLLSLFSAIADLGMEIANNSAPLSQAWYIVCTVSTYIYLTLRNATNVVLLLSLLAFTRTSFLLRKRWARIAFILPYACILIMLAQNPFTHLAFVISREGGYSRGPLMYAFYGIALIYGLVGFVYCIYCRRYLPLNKWISFLAIYLLGHLAVLIQFFRPELLVEMIFTAIGLILIMLSVMRPEERMDTEAGMLSWASYQADLKNILISGEHVQIVVIRMQNSRGIRNFLGEHEYNRYLTAIAGEIRTLDWKHPHHIELYCERPGTIYLITEADEKDAERVGEQLPARGGLARYAEAGVRFEALVCLIRCPEDLKNAEDIISLGHRFYRIDKRKQSCFYASEIVQSQTFAIEAHIETILDRAIRNDHIEMYYQPIFDSHTGRFRSAEALARLNDPEYGPISPAVFIPAAETAGFIIPIGDIVLDQVFRFISEHDLDELGLDFIEVNLSVAQCMESCLPEKIAGLQQRYGVDPARISMEITETTFENIGGVLPENVNKLIDMGYSFALDDYGIGYSGIQRVNRIPLKLVKIDKSLLDEASTENGRRILEYTIRMMQSIGKQIVAEGAETAEAVGLLEKANCDYIQGFYFSRPMPKEEFLRFLRERNGSAQG